MNSKPSFQQTPLQNAQIDWNESGTPVSNQFDDVYFSNHNGLEESRYVFLEKNNLWQRLQDCVDNKFTIAETGFGTGLNFLAVCDLFEQFRQQCPQSPLTQLHFISFEKYPLNLDDLIKANNAWPELAPYAEQLQAHYPLAISGCHRRYLSQSPSSSPMADSLTNVILDLWLGDILDTLPSIHQSQTGIVDAWFLDGFAPNKNEAMWHQDVFQGMANLTKQGGTCATFTAAGFVRRGLAEAGFDMQKTKGFGTKREMLIGKIQGDKIQERTALEAPFPNLIPPAQPSNQSRMSKNIALKEIALIGGGVASATLAESLIKRGYQVTLYCEDEQTALGASKNRQGALYPLLAELGSPLNAFFIPAFLYARDRLNALSKQVSFEHDFCGVTQLAWSETSGKKLAKMLENNLPKTLIQGLTAPEIANTIGLPSEQSGVFYPLGGWLCPKQLTQHLLQALEKTGKLTIHYQSKVHQLDWQEDRQHWQLLVNERMSTHDFVVVANGYQFSQFEQLKPIPASSVKGQVSHIPTNEDLSQLKTVLCYDGYLSPKNPATNQHCIGASYDRHHIDEEFDPQAQSQNRQRLVDSIPDQAWPLSVDVSGNESKQGIRCVTRDHLPFIGQVPKYQPLMDNYEPKDMQKSRHRGNPIPELTYYPNLFCMIGLGARGLCSAPLLAETLASQIAGEALPLPMNVIESLHPARMWLRRMKKGRPL